MAVRPPNSRPRFGQGPLAAEVLRRTIAVAANLGGRLPPHTSRRLARIGGTLEWALRPRKRRLLAENLRRAIPDATNGTLRRATREEIVNEGRRSADLLWSIAHPDEAAAALRLEHRRELEALLAGGNGLILAGPHVGGWETMFPLATLFPETRVCVIVEDDWLAWAIADARRQTGVELISVAEPPYRAIEALRQGGVLVLLADFVQPQMRACAVELLGQPADLPAGPAAIARIAGAPLVPFAVLPIDTRAWRIWTGTPIAPPARGSGRAGEAAVMQRLADAFSEVIRAHPTQWAAVYELGWRT